METKERPHGYLLSGIPNNKRGRAFIKQLREYANTERFKIVRKNNGPRTAAALADGHAPRAYDQGLPTRHATHFRIYALDHAQRNENTERWWEWRRAKDDLIELSRAHEDIKAINGSLHKVNAGLCADLEQRDTTIRDLRSAIASMNTVIEEHTANKPWCVRLADWIRAIFP